jgi:hypothetical protein
MNNKKMKDIAIYLIGGLVVGVMFSAKIKSFLKIP